MKKLIYLIVTSLALLTACDTTIEGLQLNELITASTNQIEMECGGGKTSITIDAHCDWEVLTEKDADWLEVSKKSGEKGQSNLEITLSENKAKDKRSTTITITNKRYGASCEISVNQGAMRGYISIEEDALTFIADGETKSLSVEANIEWTASCDAEWITFSPEIGKSGKTTLKITASANPDIRNRMAIITLCSSYKNETIVEEINITQKNNSSFITLSSNKIDASVEGSTHAVEIVSNIPWNISCDAQWVSLSQTSGEVGTTTMSITANANTLSEERTATVVVMNSEFEIYEKITITQSSANIVIDNSTLSYTGSGEESKYISIESNINWVTTCDADWITIRPSTGNAGTTRVEVKPQAYISEKNRSATITVKSRNKNLNIEKKISVVQEGVMPTLNVNTTEVTIKAEGEIKKVSIESNIDWTALCDADWLTITPQTGKSSTTTMTINVTPNTQNDEREAIVVVKNSEYNIQEKITVSQSSAYIFIDNSTLHYTGFGDELNYVTVESNFDWSASCDADWVTFTPQKGVSGLTTMTINVTANKQDQQRSATITIKDKNRVLNIETKINITQEEWKTVAEEDFRYLHPGTYNWSFDIRYPENETESYTTTTTTVFRADELFELSEIYGDHYNDIKAINWTITGFFEDAGFYFESNPSMGAISYSQFGGYDNLEFIDIDNNNQTQHSLVGTCEVYDNQGNYKKVELFLGNLEGNVVHPLSFQVYSDHISEPHPSREPILWYIYNGNGYIYAYMDYLNLAHGTANAPMRIETTLREIATIAGQGTPLKINPISFRK